MRLNIKQVKYFVETLDQGSLSAASQVKHVTVQAVSKALANLEEELGDTLLERGSNGIRPTPFGRAFYRKAIQVIDCFDELESFSESYYRTNDLDEELRLGLYTPEFFGGNQVCESIASFVEMQIGAKTTVPLAQGESGFTQLRTGVLDALIMTGTVHHPDTRCNVIGTVPPALMMACDHPLASQEYVSLSDLASYPVANPLWYSSCVETITSVYRRRTQDVRYVDLDTEGISDHLHRAQGVVITVNIDLFGKMHPDVVLRPLCPDDVVVIPICLVSMKDIVSPTLMRLYRLLLSGLALLRNGKPLVAVSNQ